MSHFVVVTALLTITCAVFNGYAGLGLSCHCDKRSECNAGKVADQSAGGITIYGRGIIVCERKRSRQIRQLVRSLFLCITCCTYPITGRERVDG